MGYYVYLHLEKEKVRKEVKREILSGLNKSKLVKFKLSELKAHRQLTWINSREFKYKGRMYDIVQTTSAENTLIYWCWPDDDESQIEDQINFLMSRVLAHEQQEKENHQPLTKIFKLVFIANDQDWNIASRYHFNHQTFGYRKQKIESFQVSPPVPPPQQG
ncbi:MAG: hypothetical protein KQI35_18940 [Bacteroidetes bacterium]|nr:hypothetical protein [Bacteroidota bacterium]